MYTGIAIPTPDAAILQSVPKSTPIRRPKLRLRALTSVEKIAVTVGVIYFLLSFFTFRNVIANIPLVLSNWVSNAVKFTRPGGSIFVNLSGTRINEETMVVTFSVQDSGMGIPEGTKQKLFEPFTQADSTHTRKHAGTGLGLAISKRLVDLMHGEIGFDYRRYRFDLLVQPAVGDELELTRVLAHTCSLSALLGG